MKQYPLEIVEHMDDNYTFGMYSRGYHDDTAFLAACKEWWGEQMPAGDIEHETWRTVTTRAGLYHMPVYGGRGSYPVTVYRFHEPI